MSEPAKYLLKHEGVLLGEMVSFDYDFPWDRCRFTPTPAFANFKPLFDRENALLDTPSDDRDDAYDEESDALTARIIGLGLVIESPKTGEVFRDFDLHIRDGQAELRLPLGK
ncbi:hypothetical protein [Myxococcus stipitatus]|uniref:hypothetical protein n=1 Tax=Myxococcus stipitatus TaxID=83455 RepID=UPI0030CC4F2F